MLSFVFLTDRENITLSRFNGTFSFIPDTTYKLGAVDKNHGLHLEGRDPICNFVIDSSSPSSGLFGGSFGGSKVNIAKPDKNANNHKLEKLNKDMITNKRA